MQVVHSSRAFSQLLTAACRASPSWHSVHHAAGTPDQLQPNSEASTSTSYTTPVVWVFLGPPGVGKGTYAKRMAQRFNLAHIATGDLIRHEIRGSSAIGRQMRDAVKQGKLVPDDMIFQLLERPLAASLREGRRGYILDGFPRTAAQAARLIKTQRVQMALNLSLREEVLVGKCLGRRTCSHCDASYNLADINLPASNGRPAVVMPPLSPLPECVDHLKTRDDDTEETVLHRLQSYRTQAGPVEAVFRERNLLREFELTAGIPETTPRLVALLERHMPPNRHEQQRPMSHMSSAALSASLRLRAGLAPPPGARAVARASQ